MKTKAGIWYRLGYAWETARLGPASRNGGGSGGGRSLLRAGNGRAPEAARKPAASALRGRVLDEAGGLARRVVGGRALRPPARGDLARAAFAGAGAAFAARSARAVFGGDAPSPDDPELGPELLRGAGEGLALAVLGRHAPRARLLRIALCGVARHAAAPRGGLPAVIRPIAPAAVRTLSALVPESRRSGGPLEHAAFAAAFVFLYRRGTSGGG